MVSIDGTNITGATIDGQQVGEITIDGQTAWTAIPDSVILQYFATTWTQGNTTWQDGAGTAENISLSGGPTASTLSDGSESISFDGVDDYGLVTLPSELSGGSLNAFSLEFAVEYLHGNEGRVGISDGTQEFRLQLNSDENFNSKDGKLNIRLVGDAGDAITFAPTNNPGLNDGNRHDVSIIINDASNNDVGLIIDGSSVGVTLSSSYTDGGITSFKSWTRDWAWGSYNSDGSLSDYSEMDTGAIRWHDQAITSQTIGDYP